MARPATKHGVPPDPPRPDQPLGPAKVAPANQPPGPNWPSLHALSLVGLALLNFALKYLTSIVLANALGIDDYDDYAVAIASVVFFSTLVELGLGKQSLRLLPHFLAAGQHQLAAGYWRFSMRVVLGFAVAMGLLLVSTQQIPALASFTSDDAMFLLPVIALTGVGAELVMACGAAVVATIVVRIVVPLVPLLFVLWATRSAVGDLVPSAAILAYGVGWLCGLVLLLIAFVLVCPREALRGPAQFESRAWLRGGLGFLGVAFAISALVDGTVALAELASVSSADISVYAVCIETGGFVLILVKSLDKFYLQRISGLITRGELPEIHKIRRRRAGLMLGVCVTFCVGIIGWGQQLLASFGPGFERGYFSLCVIAIATSAWTLSSLSQWLIAFTDGPARALRITLGGVFAVYTGMLLLGPSQGLVGISLAYAVMVTLMAVMLELRARAILERLVHEANESKEASDYSPPNRLV